MGLYGEKKDYEELIKENIMKANILFPLSNENRKIVISLLEQKQKIIEENGILANIKLKIIDKKIQKIQKKSKFSKEKK